MLLEVVPETKLAIEVEHVDGVDRVGVVIGVAAGDGVGGEEASGGRVVEADAHEDQAGEVVA